MSWEFSSRIFVKESDWDKYFKKISCDAVTVFSLIDSASWLILFVRVCPDSEVKFKSKFWIPLHSNKVSFQIDCDSFLYELFNIVTYLYFSVWNWELLRPGFVIFETTDDSISIYELVSVL